jgi:septum site-determining protein MinD
MGARVITVTSGKGGVGKTTATANIAIALASLGNKVCCIDADIGLRNLDIVLGLENRIVYDLVDVVEGRAKLRQAMIKDKRVEELYLIPAAQTRDKTAVSPSDMVRICDELKTMVDIVVIDSPAGIERGFRNAVAPADMVIIVTNPEVSSVRDADRIIGLIEAEGKGPGHLVINRVKSEMVKRGDMLSPEDVIDILAIKLIGLVPEDEHILVSTNRGLPAAMSDDSRAGQAFRNIARRIMGQEVPFMPLEENTSFTQNLLKVFGLGKKKEDKFAPVPKSAAAASILADPVAKPAAPAPAVPTPQPAPVAAAVVPPTPAPEPAQPAPAPVVPTPIPHPTPAGAVASASTVAAASAMPAISVPEPAQPAAADAKKDDKADKTDDAKPAAAKPKDSKDAAESKPDAKESNGQQPASAAPASTAEPDAKPVASGAGTPPGS